MEYGGGDKYVCSKCTLSLPLCGHAFRCVCVVEYCIRQLEFHRITILTRVVIFVFVCLKRYSFVVVCGGLAFSFRCCTLSCSVWLGTIVQFGRVQMEYGGGDGHVLQ